MASLIRKPYFMKTVLIVILLNNCLPTLAQEEGSATVSSIINNVLYLNNCTDKQGSFKVNQKIIVVQKEAGSIILNAGAVATKNLPNKQVARKYVVLTITDVERSENIVTAIRVSRDIQNSFVINSNAAVNVSIVTCRFNW